MGRRAATQAALDLDAALAAPLPQRGAREAVGGYLDPWSVPPHLYRVHGPHPVHKPVDRVTARDARISRCGCGEWRYRPRNQHRDRPCPVCGRV